MRLQRSNQIVMTKSLMSRPQPLSRSSKARCWWSSCPISSFSSTRVRKISSMTLSTPVLTSTFLKQRNRKKFPKTNQRNLPSGPKWTGLRRIRKRESVVYKESKTSLSSKLFFSRSTFSRSKPSSTSYRWWPTPESPGRRSTDKWRRRGRLIILSPIWFLRWT